MKIAIDARKWRDYGIGTYVRNLVRHLAHLDRETTYFLFCDRRRRGRRCATWPRTSCPSSTTPRGYSVAGALLDPAQAAPPRRRPPPLAALRAAAARAAQRSVVTIHDCIHLLFPEYLPNRAGLRSTRGS